MELNDSNNEDAGATSRNDTVLPGLPVLIYYAVQRGQTEVVADNENLQDTFLEWPFYSKEIGARRPKATASDHCT